MLKFKNKVTDGAAFKLYWVDGNHKPTNFSLKVMPDILKTVFETQK